jgi:hypothetical protein
MNKYKVSGEQVVYFEFEMFANDEEEAISNAPNWHDPKDHIIGADEIDVRNVELIEKDVVGDY